jgi:magnesium transporter
MIYSLPAIVCNCRRWRAGLAPIPYSLYNLGVITKYTFKKLTWVDLESPSKDEVASVVDTFDLPPLVGDEMLSKTLRSKVDRYDDVIYLILHFPVRHKDGKIREEEIDFVIGKEFLITTHYGKLEAIKEFSDLFEKDSRLEKRNESEHAGFLFFHLINELYRDTLGELDRENDKIREIEHLIFSAREEKTVELISESNRVLLDFKQSLRFHKEILRSFEIACQGFFGPGFLFYIHSIISEYNKTENLLNGNKEILDDLRITNDSLLTAHTNDTIKKLTVMTFIMLPLTLVTGIFGMNFGFSLVDGKTDFAIVLIFMVVIALVMYIYFRKKRWF